MEWKWYRYFEPKTVGLDFEGMMEDLRGAPEGSVVILHGVTHLLAHSSAMPQCVTLSEVRYGPLRTHSIQLARLTPHLPVATFLPRKFWQL